MFIVLEIESCIQYILVSKDNAFDYYFLLEKSSDLATPLNFWKFLTPFISLNAIASL